MINRILGISAVLMSSLAYAGGGDPAVDHIAEAQQSWAGQALARQRVLDIAANLSDNSMLGAHNSYNSRAYRDSDSYLDPQQHHTTYDQLRLGARFVEFDVHWSYKLDGLNWGNVLMLCHGSDTKIGDVHAGCSLTDRYLYEGVDEVKRWLDEPANHQEVIILYTEDHSEGRHEEMYNIIMSRIGDKVYASGGCVDVPASLSKADVLAAGKQVIWWKDRECSTHGPTLNTAFGGRYQLAGFEREYEDATGIAGLVNAQVSINADQLRQFHKQGVNLVNLDNLTYTDERIAASVWSWDVNQPDDGGAGQDCALQWANGRWDDDSCGANLPFACRHTGTGAWQVSTVTGQWHEGNAACQALGSDYVYDLPTNSASNEALKTAKAGNDKVWINYNDKTTEGRWAIPDHHYRASANAQLISCSNEWGTCDAKGLPVAYGAAGKYAYTISANPVQCTNQTFGDPASGQAKQCFYVLDANDCANEWGTCSVSGVKTVWYGQEGTNKFTTKQVHNSIACTNAAFGTDPAPGVAKKCKVLN